MNEMPPDRTGLLMLIDAAFNHTITDQQSAELRTLLENDHESREIYSEYARIEAELYLIARGRMINRAAVRGISDGSLQSKLQLDLSAAAIPTADSSPLSVAGSLWRGTTRFFADHEVIAAYLVTTLLFIVTGIVGLQMFAPHAAEPTARGIASNAGKSTVSSGLAVVGRVSGTGDCDWADDSTDADMDQDVCVGRKYALASGLLEISYASGARVLLEGPCVYTAESPTSGFLAVGKLTAKLEPPERLLAGAAVRQQRAGGKNIFSVRTPAAVVTDLGTEFGVEVEKDGRTSAHVFCGAVAVLPAAASRPSESVVLRQGDSARVGAGRNAVERVSVDPDRFVTRIAKRRVPLEVFGTGVGVRPGDPDPHWDVAAVGGDSSFVARPATVLMSTRSTWAQPEPGREKWISATSEWYWTVAAETPCTLRTTFEIREGIPDTALLRGRVYAPGGIKALRLNGRETAGFVAEEGPKYSWESGNAPQKLLIDRGFVAGRNVLEFDVISTDPPMAGQPLSALGLRVELKGWVQERP